MTRAFVAAAAAHGFHLDLGDVPTWLGVVAASVAAAFVYWQLRAQRTQLALQQDEIRRQLAVLERQQADAIDVAPGAVPLDLQAHGGGDHVEANVLCWAISVTNNSARPVRGVTARIRADPGGELYVARELQISGGGAPGAGPVQPGTGTPVLQRLYRVSLGFPVAHRDHPYANILVRFTDDTGLHWQIDEVLHLTKLTQRDW